MHRFMKNGEIHVALMRVTEYITVDESGPALCTFIMSTKEDSAQLNGYQGIEWTPLDFIIWMPSSIPIEHLEWIRGTEEQE